MKKKDSINSSIRDQIRDFVAMLKDNSFSIKSIADTMYDEAGMMAGEDAQRAVKTFGRYLFNQ